MLLLVAAPLPAQGGDDPSSQSEYWIGIDAVFTADGDYIAPTFMIDRDALHLETRYAYEGEQTTSFWAGYNIRSADGESWIVTPMAGIALGDTRGILTGVEIAATWNALDLYVEAEYLLSSGDSRDFSYCWTEFAFSPREWLRAGVASQATWSAGAPDSRQDGPLIGGAFGVMEPLGSDACF